MKKLLMYASFAICLAHVSCTDQGDDDFLNGPPTGYLRNGTDVKGTVSTFSNQNIPENFSYHIAYINRASFYRLSTKEINLDAMANQVNSTTGNADYTTGTLSFNSSDTTQSAPTNYSFDVMVFHYDALGNFVFKSNKINPSNSTLSNYVINGKASSFKVTTSKGFQGVNGKDASVVLDIRIPFEISTY